MNIKPLPIQQIRPFQPFPQRRPDVRPASYPNKLIDSSINKDFIGKLLSGSLGEITNFLNSNNIHINNIKDPNGNSPLHIVINNKTISKDEKLNICDYLINKGANVNAYDNSDMSPIHLATKLQLNDVLDLLLKKGGNVNILNNAQQNPLHIAVREVLVPCPSFRPANIISTVDIKTRDINEMARAIWQHLNDFFKLSKFDQNTKPQLHLPLLAIKNLIDESTTKYVLYLKDRKSVNKSNIPPDTDLIEDINAKLLDGITKIMLNPSYSESDKKFKINEEINSYNSQIIREISTYFDGSNKELNYFNNALKKDDLIYFNLSNLDEEAQDIFSLNESTNYNSVFSKAYDDLDIKYNKKINEFEKEFNSFLENIETIYNNVRLLHALNISNITQKLSVTFGKHEKLVDNEQIINTFENKYQLYIERFNDHVEDLNYKYPTPRPREQIEQKWDERINFLKYEYIEILKTIKHKKNEKNDTIFEGKVIITDANRDSGVICFINLLQKSKDEPHRLELQDNIDVPNKINKFGYIEIKLPRRIRPIDYRIIYNDIHKELHFEYSNDKTPPEWHAFRLYYRFAMTVDYKVDNDKVIFETRDDDTEIDYDTYKWYPENIDMAKGKKAFRTNRERRIKVKLVLNIKDKVQYYNTSILLSFFKKYYNTAKEQIENNIKILFESEELTKYKYKYNYYMMYNLMNQINFNIDEFVSYLSFIYDNENIDGLNQKVIFQLIPDVYSSRTKDIFRSFNTSLKNIKDVKININKITNDVVKILNAHQNLIISNAFVKQLLTIDSTDNLTFKNELNEASTLREKIDVLQKYPQYIEDRYKLTYKFVLDTFSDKIVGIFDKRMGSLPSINLSSTIKKIDKTFFMQAHPEINDMNFVIEIDIDKKTDMIVKYKIIDDEAKQIIDEMYNILRRDRSVNDNILKIEIMQTIFYLSLIPKLQQSYHSFSDLYNKSIAIEIIKQINLNEYNKNLTNNWDTDVEGYGTLNDLLNTFKSNKYKTVNDLVENMKTAPRIDGIFNNSGKIDNVKINEFKNFIVKIIQKSDDTPEQSGILSDALTETRDYIDTLDGYKINDTIINDTIAAYGKLDFPKSILTKLLFITCVVRHYRDTDPDPDIKYYADFFYSSINDDASNPTIKKIKTNIDDFFATEDTSIYPTAKNGRLMMVPWATDQKYSKGRKFVIKSNDKIYQNSLFIKKIKINIDNPTRNLYEFNDEPEFGIIGVRNYIDNEIMIDLLDTQKLPYDLCNTYKNQYDNTYMPYIDLISILKRVFITMVLDTRNQKIYDTIPDKKGRLLFGYKDAKEDTLFKYISAKVREQLNVESETDEVKMLVNKLIVNGVDTILNSNITNYYSMSAKKLEANIFKNENFSEQLKKVNLSFPALPNVKTIVNFADLNSVLLDTITYEEPPTNIKSTIDAHLLLMEDEIVDITNTNYKSDTVKGENMNGTVHYSRNYYDNDDVIVNRSILQCVINEPKIIKTLRSYGVNINQPDIAGNTPIMYAIETRNNLAIDDLLSIDSINLFVRNTKNQDALMHSIAGEIEHQKILLDSNRLKYSDVYKEKMLLYFDVNDELKKNMPKNMEIINYLPIYLLNNIWFKLYNNKELKEITNLFEKYIETDKKKNKEYIEIPNLFMFSDNRPKLFQKLDDDLQEYSKKLGFQVSEKKIDGKMKKYNDLIKNTNSDNIKERMGKKREKLEEKQSILGKMITQLESMNYDMNDMLSIVKVEEDNDFRSSIFNILNKLKAPELSNTLKLPELKHYILGSVIKTYHKDGEPLKRLENIHLYLSNIYTKMLDNMTENSKNLHLSKKPNYKINKNKIETINYDMEQFKSYKKDIKKIEYFMKKICDYLDQRFLEKSDIVSNIIIEDIYRSIIYTTMIVVQNSFLLSIKKLFINYITKIYGPSYIQEYSKIVELLMGLSTESRTKILSDKLDDNYDDSLNKIDVLDTYENITSTIIKSQFNIEETKNIELISFENIVSEIKNTLKSNPYLRVESSNIFFKDYDELVSYYKTLYSTSIEHQKKLVYNYIKFIMNQYNGIRTLRKITNIVL